MQTLSDSVTCVITLVFINFMMNMCFIITTLCWYHADYLCVYFRYTLSTYICVFVRVRACLCMCLWLGVCLCVHGFFPQAMSFEAHSLTVSSVMWLGLLPSDIQRFGLNICYFLLPFSASNWDYILGTCRLFVLVSVAVALFFFFTWGTASESILSFKYMSP